MNAKKGIAFILSAATCWGFLPILTRFAAANGSDAILTAAIRALVAAVFLGAYGVYKKAYRGLTWRDLVYFAIMGLFTTVGMYVFYSLSITLVSTAIAAVLLYTAPAFVILFSRLFFKETITKAKLASLLLTFLGCTLVVRLYDVDSLAVNAAGIFFGLAAGICYAMVTIFGRKALQAHSSETTSILPVLFGAAVLFCIRPPWQASFDDSIIVVIYLLIGLVGSVLPTLFYMKGLQLGVEGGKRQLVGDVGTRTIHDFWRAVFCRRFRVAANFGNSNSHIRGVHTGVFTT